MHEPGVPIRPTFERGRRGARPRRRAGGATAHAGGALAVLTALSVGAASPPPVAAQDRPPTAVERDATERCRVAAEADSTVGQGPGILLGRVIDATTRDPVPDALVWIGSADQERPGRWFETSAEGVFLLCGLPATGRLHLQATAPGRIGDPLVIESPGTDVALRDLLVTSGDSAALAPDRLEGGLLRGVVRAAETGEPLAGAVVEVVDTGSRATTNARGDFIFLEVPAGTHRVVTSYLGRTSDTVHLELAPGGLRDLAVLSLDVDPLALPELRVEVRRWVSPRLAGFYRRVDRAAGHYITREDLEHTDVVGNFRRIVGVELIAVGATDYSVRLKRGYGLNPGPCPPLIYWNGALMTSPSAEAEWEAAGMGAFQWLQDYPRHLLEGIEVYRSPVTAPGQYRMLGDACGIILVWTRDRRR